MTIRGYVALFYGVFAVAVSLFVNDCVFSSCNGHAGIALSAAEQSEAEPSGGHQPEDADLPSYMTEDPEQLAQSTSATPILAVR